MEFVRRHPRLIAILIGGLAATGFAPLGLWPVTLACVAGLMWLVENPRPVRVEHSRDTMALPPLDFSHRLKFILSACLAGSRRARGERGSSIDTFILGWCFGLGHFTVGNNWIAHAFVYQDAMPHWLGLFAVVALALYLAIFPAFATLGHYVLRRRWPGLAPTPLFAALWIVSEFARATLFTGFSWDPLGMLWLGTGVDQAARFIGTYGLSGIAIVAAGALLALVRRQWRAAAPVAVALVLLALAGVQRTAAPPESTRVAITVVQPNINQNAKYDPALEQENFRRLATLTGRSYPTRPRLIFWPEAAVPAWLEVEPEWRARIAALEGPHDLLMLGGDKVYFREDPPGIFNGRSLAGANNSAWVLTPDGRLAGRYDKAHLVPYGEYLPMRPILSAIGLSRLVPGDADFWPGPGPRSLALSAGDGRPALKMGVQICYEIIFSGEVVHRQNRPDFLYNPSNDAWFGAWGPPQHVAQARMRAIEEAMPVIRSTPTGISAVIDARGRLIASIPHHQAGAINALLPRSAPPTLFARFGNLLPMGFALLLALTAMMLARRSASR